MNLIQNGFSCPYEMDIFIDIFFAKNEDGLIVTSLTHENDNINVYVEIDFNNKQYFGDYNFYFKNSVTDKKEIKKNYSVSITKAFCNICKSFRNISLPWGVLSGIRPAKVVRQYKEIGYSESKIKGVLKDLYGVSEEKIDLCIKVAENEEKILSKRKDNSVSIYIGIPFCPTRCLYCSFVSTDIKRSGKYMKDFLILLKKEIEKTKEVLEKLNLFVDNIYIGGGTPTTLNAGQLEFLLDAINDNLISEKLNEFTLEAGRPDTITYDKLKIIKEKGVNRISINPQTMNDETLKVIGRCHDSKMTVEAYKMAREAGFDNINMDLIAGLPGETPQMFYKSLDEVIKLNPENITVHSMCVKKAARLKFSDIELTQSNYMNDMISYTQKRMSETKREPYYMYRQKNISGNLENVGYAFRDKMGFYNINIMEEVQTIIALGGGGVTKICIGERIERIFNFKDPHDYVTRFDDILKKKDEIIKIFKGE